ncbi:MAG: putative rane-associated phospholipid phosphatase [Cytophagaceae bacterium]|jgi:undecaprenyl-diphosphatase|nr:putative rane-associated phospholipid phosphatase [Cytophagaceae bacterium]
MSVLNQLIEWDQQALVYLNTHLCAAWADLAMITISGTFIWVPFYAVLLYFLIKKFRYDTVWIVICVAITIALCDQLASGLTKPLTERLRPCHEPSILPLLRMVTDCGGTYGFFSSHASNTFGLACFIWLIFGKAKPWGWLFAWAAIVSYSRIYLGKHYPLDIMAGAVCGVAVAYLMVKLCKALMKRYPIKSNSNG